MVSKEEQQERDSLAQKEANGTITAAERQRLDELRAKG